MADSGSVAPSMSKNQKKRARKKLLKKEGESGDDSTHGVVSETVEMVGEGVEEKAVVSDPKSELKLKISEAKANQDHEAAQKLREELWKLRDKGPTSEPRFSAVNVSTELALGQEHLSTGSSSDPLDKKMSKLKKKLKQIETLEDRQDKGEKLEANQVTKIAAKQELLDEIAEIEEILANT